MTEWLERQVINARMRNERIIVVCYRVVDFGAKLPG